MAQVSMPGADSCYAIARRLAFADSNYAAAIPWAKAALAQAPAYAEVGRFLASLYWWNHQPDSAVQLLRKNSALKMDSTAQSMKNQFVAGQMKHRIGAGYEQLRYSEAYNESLHGNPWQQFSCWYTLHLQQGTYGIRFNQAWQGTRSGHQIELEAYPQLGKWGYLFLHGAFANAGGIYPVLRSSASLNFVLPNKYELEAGVRYLRFDSATIMWVGGVSKYAGNWLLNVRGYYSAQQNTSVNAMARYYYGGFNQFVACLVGTGISPDNRSQNNVLGGVFSSQPAINIMGQYRFTVHQRHVLELFGQWRQEKMPAPSKSNGTQLSGGITYQYIF